MGSRLQAGVEAAAGVSNDPKGQIFNLVPGDLPVRFHFILILLSTAGSLPSSVCHALLSERGELSKVKCRDADFFLVHIERRLGEARPHRGARMAAGHLAPQFSIRVRVI